MTTNRQAPRIGEPYELGAETIVPTYVHESEAPRSDGSCVTVDFTRDPSEFTPAGWYVECHYVGHTQNHRRFVPFPITCGFCDRPIAGEPVEMLDAMPGEPTIACQPCYAKNVMQAPPDPGPGSPCPYCDEASIVDEGGACVHCGVRRVEVSR